MRNRRDKFDIAIKTKNKLTKKKEIILKEIFKIDFTKLLKSDLFNKLSIKLIILKVTNYYT